ncbi:MAG: hypothetical protein QOE06_1882 [Thermoleophilaceae bacterium]|jgi:hypothetical protein|nr:hypothetical protein [Thermoleophilaceae bacterium]
MFPLLRNRAARALDVAIEFATLGEYRLADPVAPVAPARGARRRAEPTERREGVPARPAARLVVPASAAARFAAAGAGAPPEGTAGAAHTGASRLRPAPMPAPSSITDIALAAHGVVERPSVRTRGGAAPAPPQPCESARR